MTASKDLSKHYDPFSKMTWKEFEDYVIEVLSNFYASCGLQVHKTPYVNDGGKDGYGSLLIAPPNPSEIGQLLSHETLFWAEVKKRTTSSANEGDIGGHIILAMDSYVHKLIFVTNGTFTKRAKKVCTRVGRRLNMGINFVDGIGLVELAQGLNISSKKVSFSELVPIVKDKDQQDRIHITTGFVAQQGHELVEGAVLNVNPGEIVYWTCEISGRCARNVVKVEPILRKIRESNLMACCLSAPSFQIDATESVGRVTFGIWGCQAGEYRCADIIEDVCISHALPVKRTSSNTTLNIRTSVLAETIPPSKESIVKSLTADFGILQELGGVRGGLIQAVGGVGKSFLLNKIRQDLLPYGLREICLDGARQRSVTDVTQKLVQESFPIPADLSPNIHPQAIQEWVAADTPPDSPDARIAIELMEMVNGDRASSADAKYTASAIATALSKASNISPLLFTFEDLHKVSPSVLSFLEKLITQLSSRKQGHVYFIFTTRPHANDYADQQEEWLKGLEGLCGSQAHFQHHRLTSPTPDEALCLLKGSLKGLSDAESFSIIEQVGTNPFNLREALLYLRSLDVITSTSPIGLFVSDSEGVSRAIDSQTLQNATEKRLRLLFEKEGDALRDFLVAGACLGKFFSIDMARAACSSIGTNDVYQMASLCERNEVLRSDGVVQKTGIEDCGFDHDLVRMAILKDVGSFEIRSTAQRLIDEISIQKEDDLLLRLSYIAGRAGQCCEAVESLVEQATKERRYMEALEYSLVNAAIVLNSGDMFRKGDFLRSYLKRIDESLGIVPVPKTRKAASDHTQMETLALALEQIGKVGTFDDELSTRLITIGMMNAQKYPSTHHKSLFTFFEGRLRFGQCQYDKAITLFESAEQSWPTGKDARSKLLSRIRLRIAICERHLGRVEDARLTMHRALRFRDGVDWGLFQQVSANLGAFYMYDDQQEAKRYWSKGLRAAIRTGDKHQISHFLNDLGHIEFMLNNYDLAEAKVAEAAAVADRHGVLKESIRSNIFYGCIGLVRNKLEFATTAFHAAEADAFSQHNLRRLWRIRANLATVAELQGNMEEAFVKDWQSLAQMPISNEMVRISTGLKKRSRVSGALVNIMFRYHQVPELYAPIKSKLDEIVWEYATMLHQGLVEDPTDQDKVMGPVMCLYKPISNSGVRRFLLTE